ncbi:glycosyltransferase family 4 protein [Virgibacillus kimchii]
MKVLVLANYGMGLYKFRKELLEKLMNDGYEVYVSFPKDEYTERLEGLGCNFIDTELDRRGVNPIVDLKLLLNYRKIIKKIKPDIVLTYTIKPNVYGGIACRITNTPYISNITGLGTAIENKGIIRNITLKLYKIGLKKAACVFFQNKSNHNFFIENKIINGKTRLIPGSGVNLKEHKFEEYPPNDKEIIFLFIGRMMKDKGIEELMQAARIVKKNYPNVQFDLIGDIEEDYQEKLDECQRLNIINYYGKQRDVHSYIRKSHATILPSYHEGLSNVLLETASSGRPILATKIPGCIETFIEGESGYSFDVKDVESLVNVIIKFIKLPYDQKKAMGISGRRKMENEYDRNIVINAYIEEISMLINKENNNERIRRIG